MASPLDLKNLRWRNQELEIERAINDAGPLDTFYVRTPSDGGSDTNSGKSWNSAKATINSAVGALRGVSTGGSAHQTGKIIIGPGLFEPPSKVLFASEIVFEGAGAVNVDGTRGGTVIRMPNGFNDHLFGIDPAYTDWAHFVAFRHLSLEGNKENQAGFGVERFLDDSGTSGTLTFSNSASTITRSAGSWVADGYLDGMKIRVHGTVSNNNVFTIAAGGVSASALTVEETLTDEGPINGGGVHASPYSLVQITRPGFQTYFENVLFRNSPSYGIDISGAITNLLMLNCGGVKCQQGFLYALYPDTGNLMNLSLAGTTQIDDCGPAPIFIEDRGDGGVNICNIHNLECEAAVSADLHQAIIRYHKIDGNNPVAFRIGGVNAWRSGSIGQGYAVVHEMSGGGGRWNILGGVFMDNYANEFRSDHRNFSIPQQSGQQTGQPILFGLHTGPRSSFWLNKVQVFSGSGSPEGAVTANPGSVYFRDDGGAGTSFYVKESGTGNTGWIAK